MHILLTHKSITTAKIPFLYRHVRTCSSLFSLTQTQPTLRAWEQGCSPKQKHSHVLTLSHTHCAKSFLECSSDEILYDGVGDDDEEKSLIEHGMKKLLKATAWDLAAFLPLRAINPGLPLKPLFSKIHSGPMLKHVIQKSSWFPC